MTYYPAYDCASTYHDRRMKSERKKERKREKAMRDSIAVVGRWDEHICVAVSGDKGGRHTKSKSSGTQETGKLHYLCYFSVVIRYSMSPW